MAVPLIAYGLYAGGAALAAWLLGTQEGCASFSVTDQGKISLSARHKEVRTSYPPEDGEIPVMKGFQEAIKRNSPFFDGECNNDECNANLSGPCNATTNLSNVPYSSYYSRMFKDLCDGRGYEIKSMNEDAYTCKGGRYDMDMEFNCK